MKKKMIFRSIFLSTSLIMSISCTNLEEEILDGSLAANTPTTSINTESVLKSAYEGLRDFQAQGQMFALDEMSTDALAGPTRGADWDDNGAWRQIHTHNWTPNHIEVRNAWISLLSNEYKCDLIIDTPNATNSEIIQARFLKAFYYFNVLDLYGQTPYRDAGSDQEDPAKVRTRPQAVAYVISELEAILPNLPAKVAGDPSIANKDAAHFLLAKLYLNKGVYDAANPAGPYTFSPADMTKVVSNVDAITGATLATNYWDNFAPANNTSPEILFTSKNVLGNSGNVQSRWRMCSHYNQTPGGWNGFATLSEYYNKYSPDDKRIKNSATDIIKNFGSPVGFRIGQQYGPGGVTPLKDRTGNLMVFTPELTLITSGSTLETAGIRGMKYIPDIKNIDNPENDYVFMRYSDALLMKAEAILRGGTGTAPDMTAYFARTGQPSVTLNDLPSIYAERGRELWWEGWRRNDMIRFGKFLDQRALKPYKSKDKYALFPIPADALLNPNIKQNPGY
jgi:starch-binding outer membrane protein, SusD/RagB family